MIGGAWGGGSSVRMTETSCWAVGDIAKVKHASIVYNAKIAYIIYIQDYFDYISQM